MSGKLKQKSALQPLGPKQGICSRAVRPFCSTAAEVLLGIFFGSRDSSCDPVLPCFWKRRSHLRSAPRLVWKAPAAAVVGACPRPDSLQARKVLYKAKYIVIC